MYIFTDFCSCSISLHNPPHEGSYVLKGHMNIINDLCLKSYDLSHKRTGQSMIKVVSFDLLPIYSSLECVAFDVVLSTASCYRFICFYNPPSCVNSVDTITLCSLIDFLSI